MISMTDARRAAFALARKILAHNPSARRLWGVPRGGVPAALLVALAANEISMANVFRVVDTFEEAEIVVDDLVDSGRTRAQFAGKPFAALFTKRAAQDDADGWHLYGHVLPIQEWVVFPWEASEAQSASDIVVRLLQFVGEDPKREGLIETPTRTMNAWREWTAGYGVNPADVLKSFEDGASSYDEMVLVKDIPVYSHCEHHLAPFFGVAHVAYVPDKRIVGLSKLSRLVDVFARRLQVQERLTVQIADALLEALAPKGVGVMVQCRHLCMESRGVARSRLVTVTTALRGCIKEGQAREEFLETINAQGAV